MPSCTSAVDEAFKVRWNGEEVASFGGRRPQRFDQDRIPVRIAKGRNSCLLKICNQGGPWNFHARLCDPAGNPLRVQPLTEMPEKCQLEGFAEATFERAPDGLSEALAAKGPLARFFSGILIRNRRAHDLKERPEGAQFERAFETWKHAGIAYRIALAKAPPADATQRAQMDRNPLRQALEQVLLLDPEHVPALTKLAQHYSQWLPIPRKAEAFLNRAVRANETAPMAVLARAAWLANRNRPAEALHTLKQHTQVENADWRLLSQQLGIYRQLGRHPEAPGVCAPRAPVRTAGRRRIDGRTRTSPTPR